MFNKKKIYHNINKIMLWFNKKMSYIDQLNKPQRYTLGVFLITLGSIFWLIPFINGIIFLIVGFRCFGRGVGEKIFRKLGLKKDVQYPFVQYGENIYEVRELFVEKISYDIIAEMKKYK